MDTSSVRSSEFAGLAQKLVSLACALCERRLAARKSEPSPELHALSAAAVALDKAVAAFIAAERLGK